MCHVPGDPYNGHILWHNTVSDVDYEVCFIGV